MLRAQRLVGNAHLAQRLPSASAPASTPSLQRQVREGTLSDALGFRTQFENVDGIINGAHPILSNIIALTRELLVKKFMEHDEAGATRVYREVSQLYDNLRNVVQGLGRSAPDQITWAGESMALEMLIGDAKSGAVHAHLGAYSEGRERHSLRALNGVARRLVRVMSPDAGPAMSRSATGEYTRKIYLGTAMLPQVLINFYLKLKINLTVGGTSGASTSASVGASASDSSAPLPSAELSRTGAHGSVTGSIAGSEGGGATGTVSGTTTVGGAELRGQLDTTGAAEGRVTVPAGSGWSSQVTLNSSGVSYRVSHSTVGGAEMRGGMDGVSLTAIAPELSMGAARVTPSIEMQVQPNPLVFARTVTQSPEAIAASRRAMLMSLGALFGAAVVGTVAGAAIGETIILIAVTEEAAPVVLTLAGAM
jgi:hypothetical protein